MSIITNNSEILLITDCIDSNPNGNPDAENAPRMDEDTQKIKVSDVRNKRYIRENLKNKGYSIFVSKDIDENTGKEKAVKADERTKMFDDVRECIDVRLFGGVFTVKKDNFNYTGPVQFGWGTSLHKAVLSDHGITTSFKTTDNGSDSTGSMGRDKRVDYALIATQGRIDANKAKITLLTEEDLTAFDESVVNLYASTNTRSKIGQTVRMYLRVETVDNHILKRLEEYISYISDSEYPKELKDGYIEVSELLNYIAKKKNIISCVKAYVDDRIDIRKNGESINFINELTDLGVTVCNLEV